MLGVLKLLSYGDKCSCEDILVGLPLILIMIAICFCFSEEGNEAKRRVEMTSVCTGLLKSGSIVGIAPQ